MTLDELIVKLQAQQAQYGGLTVLDPDGYPVTGIHVEQIDCKHLAREWNMEVGEQYLQIGSAR